MGKISKIIGESNAKIDTIQISTALDNIYNNDYIGNFSEMFNFINKRPNIYNERANIVLQPSYYDGNYSDFYTLSEYKKRLEVMLEKINIMDNNKVNFARLDFCFDFAERFEEIYILGRIVTMLIKACKKSTTFKTIMSVDDVTGEKTHLRADSLGFEVAWYDKEKESKGRHNYKSRLELRFKRRHREIGTETVLLKQLLNLLKETKNKKLLGEIEIENAKRIISSVKKDNMDLTHFLKNNKDLLISKNTLKIAYKDIYKGKTDEQFENWYKNLWKIHRLKACKWGEIEAFIDNLIKSLKIFIKN